MRKGRASSTAAWVAFCRGYGSLLPEGAALVVDPYGIPFAGKAARVFADTCRRFPALAEQTLRRGGPLAQSVLWLQIRTRVLDEALLAFARAGGRQVLLLGAGFDCRAARFAHELECVTVFEVDHPDTQAKKRRVLLASNAVQGKVEYLAWDFERQPMHELPERLAERGHDPSKPTLTIWEGVTMYLEEAAIEATVAAVRELSAPGSLFAITYFDKARLERPSRGAWLMATVVRALGEPFRFGWRPQELPGWLSDRGFALESDRTDLQLAEELLEPAEERLVREASSHIAVATRTA